MFHGPEIQGLRIDHAIDGNGKQLAELCAVDVGGSEDRFLDVLPGAKRIIVVGRDVDLRVEQSDKTAAEPPESHGRNASPFSLVFSANDQAGANLQRNTAGRNTPTAIDISYVKNRFGNLPAEPGPAGWLRRQIDGQHHDVAVIGQGEALDGLGAVDGEGVAVEVDGPLLVAPDGAMR